MGSLDRLLFTADGDIGEGSGEEYAKDTEIGKGDSPEFFSSTEQQSYGGDPLEGLESPVEIGSGNRPAGLGR